MAVALELFIEELPGGERRWQEDSCDAFSRMYARCHRPLVAYCQRLVIDRGVAEDIAQEALTNAWASWDRYSSARPFWPWVATIARRLCIDRRRREDRRVARLHAEASVCEQQHDEPGEILEARDERRQALEALRRLRPGYQRILGLREIDGWSYEDIARFEGTTVESVRAGLRRARIALRASYLRGLGGAPAMLVLGAFRRARQRLSRLAERASVAGPAPSSVLVQRLGDALTGIAAVALTAAAATSGGAVSVIAGASHPAARPVAEAAAAPAAPAHAATGPARSGAPAAPRRAAVGPVALGLVQASQPSDADISSVVASPSYADDGTLFAVGRLHGGCPAAGCSSIFRTSDRGASWERLGYIGVEDGQILLPPSFPADRRIYLATPSSLQVSIDGGGTFVALTPLGGATAMSPRFSAGDPRILVGAAPGWEFHAGARDDGVVTPLSYVPPPMGVMLTFAFAPDGTLLAGGTMPDGDEASRASVFRCTGSSCLDHTILPGVVGVPQVAVAPTASATSYTWIGSRLFRSGDGAATFEPVAIPGGGVIRQVAFGSHGDVLVATDGERGGGLFRSSDGRTGWVRLGAGTPLASGAAGVAVTPDGRIVAGAAPASGGGLWCSTDGGRTWRDRCA